MGCPVNSGRIVALSAETMRHLEVGRPVYDKAKNMLGVIKGDDGKLKHLMRLDKRGAQAVVASNAATLEMTGAVSQQLAGAFVSPDKHPYAVITTVRTDIGNLPSPAPSDGEHGKTRTSAYKYAHRVGKTLKLIGERDFLVLVDLGDADDPPRCWVIPTGIASGLLRNEQIRTSEVAEFEGRWELLDLKS